MVLIRGCSSSLRSENIDAAAADLHAVHPTSTVTVEWVAGQVSPLIAAVLWDSKGARQLHRETPYAEDACIFLFHCVLPAG